MYEYITYNYIRNKIRKFSKKSLLKSLYLYLSKDDIMDDYELSAIWHVLLLIKWVYLNGVENQKSIQLTENDILKLLYFIQKFEGNILNPYVKKKDWESLFQIVGYQQFYLQEKVHWKDFAQQLKLFTNLKSKYDIDNSFQNKIGLSIYEFLATSYILWMYSNMNTLLGKFVYNGIIREDVFDVYAHCMPKEKLDKYIHQLLLDEKESEKAIISYKKALTNPQLQPFEISFFTMYPFQNLSGKTKIIHKSVFAYTCCYYIYDFMKDNDTNFTQEFGKRFEKYIEIGLLEANVKFKNENDLRKLYGNKEKVVDYFIKNENILIECKGIEPNPIPSVIPTINHTYNALKDSIIKAYTQQMFSIIKNEKNEAEYYGVIITYKNFYYSSLSDLSHILKFDIDKFCEENNFNNNPLPPENVFVINLSTWDRIVQILKYENVALIEILQEAKKNNNIEKSKLFSNHLKKFDTHKCKLEYLKEEYDKFNILFKK